MASTNRVSKEKPQGTVDGSEASNRGGRYGEQYNLPAGFPRHSLADEGSYFVATSPTPGTGIAVTGSITTFTDSGTNVGTFFLKNTESKTASFPKRIYFDYLKLISIGVPTSAIQWTYAIVLDDNPVRLTSGGTVLIPTNPNMDSSVVSIGTGSFGALVTAAASNRRLVARGNIKATIPVIYDTLMIVCGGAPGAAHSGATTVPGIFIDVCPPIIIGPQQNMLISMWGAANAGAITWEYEAGWWER